MSKVVVLMSSDGAQNLSDDAYAAYGEPGTSVTVSLMTAKLTLLAENNAPLTAVEQADGGDGAAGTTVILSPHPHRRPVNVTVKEQLTADQVQQMLGDSANWKLAVTNGMSTNVLTKDALQEAWDTDASGKVTKGLRATTPDEQAVLDDAKERFTPKAGAARYTASLTAPGANIALLAIAVGGFVALKPDQEVARPLFGVIAGLCALVSVGLAFASNFLLKKSNVQLSRLDLLQKRSGPPAWLPNTTTALFLVALILAFFSVVPADKSPGKPAPSFGTPTITKSGGHTKAKFEVKWTNLADTAAKVKTTAIPATGGAIATTTPKAKGAAAVSQSLSVTVTATTTISVSTQALDAKDQPVGDSVTHTYKVS